jgi:hypothetical protein
VVSAASLHPCGGHVAWVRDYAVRVYDGGLGGVRRDVCVRVLLDLGVQPVVGGAAGDHAGSPARAGAESGDGVFVRRDCGGHVDRRHAGRACQGQYVMLVHRVPEIDGMSRRPRSERTASGAPWPSKYNLFNAVTAREHRPASKQSDDDGLDAPNV